MPRVGTGLVAGVAVALASCSGGSQSATPVPRVRPQSLASSTTTVTTTTVAPIASPDQLVAPTDASSTAADLTRVERALPEDVKPTVLANRDAAVRRSSPELGAPPTALPDWTIRTPPPPAVLVGYYREAEARSGIPWVYLAAVHFVESRMGRIHGNSPAGAQGPMQFLANTWATFGNGGDINDDHDDRGNAAATRGLAQTLMLSLW